MKSELSKGNYPRIWDRSYICHIRKVGDIVSYNGKRAKIIETSALYWYSGVPIYFIEVYDNAGNMTDKFWVNEGEIAAPECECGAKHVRGSENLHYRWCPAYKGKK